jgi:hypothetical protein
MAHNKETLSTVKIYADLIKKDVNFERFPLLHI